jgi:hypothetical protein
MEKQPTGRGPEGSVENGSAASLLVSHVSIKMLLPHASQTTHFEGNETQGIQEAVHYATPRQ